MVGAETEAEGVISNPLTLTLPLNVNLTNVPIGIFKPEIRIVPQVEFEFIVLLVV